MSLFSATKKEIKLDLSPRDKEYFNHNTHLSENTRIDGHIRCESNLRIDGTLKGDIICEGRVVIGATGIVEGNVRSKFLDLEGTILGDIVVMSGLVLKSKSNLQGNIDIQSGSLEIQHEAVFNGVCQMNKKPQIIESTPSPSAAQL